MTTATQAAETAAWVAFFTHDDRQDATDPVNAPDVECSTDEDTDITYPPFGGTR